VHKLIVLYGHPKDPAHFRRYYVETHLPLAARLPGLKGSRYSFAVEGIGAELGRQMRLDAPLSRLVAKSWASASDRLGPTADNSAAITTMDRDLDA